MGATILQRHGIPPLTFPLPQQLELPLISRPPPAVIIPMDPQFTSQPEYAAYPLIFSSQQQAPILPEPVKEIRYPASSSPLRAAPLPFVPYRLKSPAKKRDANAARRAYLEEMDRELEKANQEMEEALAEGDYSRAALIHFGQICRLQDDYLRSHRKALHAS